MRSVMQSVIARYKKSILFTLLLSLLICSSMISSACSLVSHEWEPVFHYEIPTSAPLIPLLELNLIMIKKTTSTNNILWVTNHNRYTKLISFFFPIICNLIHYFKLYDLTVTGIDSAIPDDTEEKLSWLKKATCHSIYPNENIHNFITKLKTTNDSPIIVGSDKNTLKIVLFSDKNSKGRCYQLILMQTGRVRIVQNSPKRPIASEITSSAYISMIFFDSPLYNNIMSVSIYPIAGIRVFPQTSENLVYRLIDRKLLEPRSSTEMDPASYNIPEIK